MSNSVDDNDSHLLLRYFDGGEGEWLWCNFCWSLLSTQKSKIKKSLIGDRSVSKKCIQIKELCKVRGQPVHYGYNGNVLVAK